MNYIMILALLLMGTSISLGHSIRKLEINNKTDADVYEIKEDASTNTVAFVNPKAEKPTLREIVYYHMIERPYQPDEGGVRYETEEGPEMDETMRPFTNSHGFPFLESVEKKLDVESKNELEEDIPKEEEVVIEYIPGGDDEEYIYEEIYEEEFPVDIKITKQEENKEIPTTEAPEISKEMSTEAKIEETTETITEKTVLEEDVIKTSTNPETTTATHLMEEPTQAVTVSQSPITTLDTEEPVFEIKAKTARNLLFDQVKERYYSKPNETQNTSTTAERRKREIDMHIPEAPRLGELNYDSLPPYLRRLMISTEKPKARIIPDSESDEEERLDDIEKRIHKLMSSLKTADSSEEKPRTYGMNLTGDSGYVWNDMTDPGFHYQVEASESIEEEIKETDSTVKPESLNHDQVNHDQDNHDQDNHDKDNRDQDNNDERSNEHNSREEKHEEERENNSEHDNDDHKVTSESMEDSVNSFEDKGRKRNKHKENDDSMDQLIDNDQFWKWLADWTSVYMDVLTEHIKEAVHQEVIDQIKAQEEDEHNKDSKAPEEQKDIPKDNVKEIDSDKPGDIDTEKLDDEKTTPEPATDKVTENNQSGSDNKDEKSDVDEEDLLRKRKDKEDKNNKVENPIIKDEETKNKETKNESKPKETTKLEAQNIYGNTIGGDKVTNIFIFYPNQDADKVIQDIPKLNNSNNFQIDVRLNVSDKDKDDDISKKDASTATPIEKNKEVSIDITTEIPKESSKTTESSIDIEEKSKDEAISEVPTTNDQEATTTEQTDLKNTTENEPKTDNSSVESTTESGKHDLPKDKIKDTTKPTDLQNTTENEPTTESSKVESTTELEKQDLPKDNIEDKSKAPKNDKKKDEEVIEKTEESETEQIEKHQTTKIDNETTTKKIENKEEIVSSTIISNPEISTEPSV